jgi:hypothetical protein
LLNLAVKNVSGAADAGEVVVNVSAWTRAGENGSGGEVGVKRMTAPGLDSKDSGATLWAGQSYENGTASGTEVVERLAADGTVRVRGSEGVLVFF